MKNRLKFFLVLGLQIATGNLHAQVVSADSIVGNSMIINLSAGYATSPSRITSQQVGGGATMEFQTFSTNYGVPISRMVLRGNTSNDIEFYDKDGSEFVHFDGTNRYVGIGNSTPSYNLDILSANTIVAAFGRTGTSGLDAGIRIDGARNGSITSDVAFVDFRNFDSDEGSGTNYQMARISGGMNDVSGQTGYLTFKVNNGSGLTNAMRIDKSGNVGIGTDSPVEQLTLQNATNDQLGLKNSYDNSWGFRTGNSGSLIFKDDGVEKMRMTGSGYLGIGTTTPSSKLEVDGTITSEEVKVEVVGAPDYVFAPEYELRSLKETEEYIQLNRHLPEIPSAAVMEANGVELGEMNMLLLKKIEELTLHLIEQNKKIESLTNEMSTVRKMEK